MNNKLNNEEKKPNFNSLVPKTSTLINKIFHVFKNKYKKKIVYMQL